MSRRIATALVLIPVVILLVLYGHPYLLAVFQVAMTLAAVWEYFRIADGVPGIHTFRVAGYAAAAAMAILSLSDSPALGIFIITLLLSLVLMMVAMGGDHSGETYLASVAVTLFSVIYVAAPVTLLVWVRNQYEGGAFLVLFTLLVLWASDSAGYLIGKSIGRHKSSPNISPNKTWEGTVGSFGAALLVGIAGGFWVQDWRLIPLSAVLNVAGQLGDLAESAMKRGAGMKDSSHLVPGHGGVLDRIDSLLFAAPVLWYYWILQLG